MSNMGKIMIDRTIQIGDVLNIEGVYTRRTFWEWLTRTPRKLRSFQCTAQLNADGEAIDVKSDWSDQ